MTTSLTDSSKFVPINL